MERWDLFDRNGEPLGRTIRRGERLCAGEYHQVVHIWMLNSADRLLIQRRSRRRKLMPGVWAVTSGSVIAGETPREAARRELGEELGVQLPDSAFESIGCMTRRNSLCHVFVVRRNITVPEMRLQREEVSAVRWVAAQQLVDMLKQRQFHHYGAPYFRFVFDGITRLTGRDLAPEEDFKCSR